MVEQQPRDFDRIVPAAFKASDSAPLKSGPRTSRAGWRFGFGLLGAVVLAAVLWAVLRPGGVATDSVDLAPPSLPRTDAPGQTPAVGAAGEPSPAPPTETPWRDTELAAARRAAQDILAQVSEKKRELESRRVDLWGAQALAAALGTAAEGDALYRERQFAAAQEHYRAALNQLVALGERIPMVLEEAVTQGRAALVAGTAASAEAAFERALAVDPGNAAARAGLARAKVLDEVKRLLAEAEDRENNDDLETAKVEYERALALDGRTEAAREGVRRIDQKLTARAFTAAMSEGYAALKEAHLDAAKHAFESALNLRPGAEDAQQGLALTANRRIEASIRSWLDKAAQGESAEQWGEATRAYQEVLALDDSVAAAKAGAVRARMRAELDERLTAALAKPERLQDEGVYRETLKLQAQARAVQDPGPRLQSQIDTLDGWLKSAVEPVLVTLRSDEATDVNVYKVARLGKFHSKQVALKPGSYIAVGTRDGYRDVRREFQVIPGQPPMSVVVECTEKVVF